MSGNSRSSCLQTAPIVSDFCRTGPSLFPTPTGGRGRACSTSTLKSNTRSPVSPEEGQLVLAHLKLVAVLELVGLDPLAVHIRAVQRAEIVDVDAVAPSHEQRVVARDRHVVEEDLGLGAAPDPRLVARHEERLAGATAAGADDQRGVLAADRVRVERLEVAGLADLPGRRGVVTVLVRPDV